MSFPYLQFNKVLEELIGGATTRSQSQRTRSGKTRGLEGLLPEKKRAPRAKRAPLAVVPIPLPLVFPVAPPAKAAARAFFDSLVERPRQPTLAEEINSFLRIGRQLSQEPREPRDRKYEPRSIFSEARSLGKMTKIFDYPREERKVLTIEEKAARRKQAFIRQIADGETETIRQIDEQEYDSDEECDLDENRAPTQYGDYLRTYEYTSPGHAVRTNLQNYMNCVNEMSAPRIANFINTRGPTKIFFAYRITFENTNGQLVSGQFMSKVVRTNNAADVPGVIQDAEQKIWNDIDKFNTGGSGRIIRNINIAYVNLGVYNPVAGAGRSYMPVPDDMKKMRCLTNIKNEDNECFAWCVLARLHPAVRNKERVSNYTQYYDELKFPEEYDKKIGMPPNGKILDKFEQLNNLAIYIYTRTSKKNGCAPYRISKRVCSDLRSVTMIIMEDEECKNRHYVLVNNLDAFLAKPGRQMYHCRFCMTGYTRQDIRDKHMTDGSCIQEGELACKIIMPEAGTVIKYDNNPEYKKNTEWKEHRYPIVVYADTESVLMKPIETKTVRDWFTDTMFTEKIQDIICSYADVDHCRIQSGETIKYQYHKMSSFCYHVVFTDDLKDQLKPRTFLYRGEDAGKKFLEHLAKDCNFYRSKIRWTKEVNQDPDGEGELGAVTKSVNKKFEKIPRRAIKIPVFLHNLSGYDAHPILLELAHTCKKASCIPRTGEKFVSFEADGMVFKDSISFLSASLDKLSSNLLMQFPADQKTAETTQAEIDEYETRGFVETRKYYREQKNVKNFYYKGDDPTDPKAFKNPYEYSYKRIRMLCSKGIYPYEHFDNFGRFKETEIPHYTSFVSTLDKCSIEGIDYDATPSAEKAVEEAKLAREKAVTVFSEFKCKTLGDYSDLYLKTDTLILADIFEAFRTTCLREYKLDPVNYYTLPGYSWDCCLKKSEVKLEPFVEGQYDMLLFTEKCIRGGISMIPNRYGKAHNRYTEEKIELNKKEEEKYLVYLDANALYSGAMCQYLPYGGYKWVTGEDKMNKMLKDIKLGKMHETSPIGCMLEVDLEYPDELHNLHNDYPCAPESVVIDNTMLSPYAIGLKFEIAKLQKARHKIKETGDYKDPGAGHYDGITIDNNKVPKLVCRLTNKKKYVVHYRTLKVYMDLGLKVTKVHRILSFKQAPWMKSFMEMNINLRKAAKNEFEKALFKLINNATFGKTMENVRKRKTVDLIIDKEILKKRLNSIKTGTWEEIKGGLVIMNVRKESMLMNKPIIVGASILDISKTTMYNFHYNVMKAKYGSNAKLLFTDTDSLCYEITYPTGGDYYKDIVDDKNFMSKLDTSCYKDIKDGPRKACYEDKEFGGKIVKGTMGLFKDVMADDGHQMAVEFVGLRAKMYSLMMFDNITEKSTAKGVKTKAKKHIKHEKYKACLFGKTPQERCQMIKFNVIRSHKHQLFSETISKISLSASDDKFYQLSDTTKYAYGHYMIDLIEGL